MHAKSTEWIFTSPLDFGESESRKLNESSFRVLPSPYAMPIAMRSIKEGDKRTLELRYLSSESTSRGTYLGESEIEYGRRTLRPRIISVALDSSASTAQFIQKVDRALESFSKVHGASSHPGSAHGREDGLKMTLSLIRSFVKKYQSQLSEFSDGFD